MKSLEDNQERALITADGYSRYVPCWSRDGARIVYRRTRPLNAERTQFEHSLVALYAQVELKSFDQARQQCGAARNVADDYVLVLGVSARAVDAQSIEHWHAQHCYEVAIRAAAD